MHIDSPIYRKAFTHYLRSGITVEAQLEAASEIIRPIILQKSRHSTALAEQIVNERISELRQQFAAAHQPFPNQPPPDTAALEKEFAQQQRALLEAFATRPEQVFDAQWNENLAEAENFLRSRFRQKLDPVLQPHYGVKYFTWISNSNNPCSICAANDGQTFAWGDGEEPPGCDHCQCTTAPAFKNEEEPEEPPLEPVYPELLLLPFFRIGKLIAAWRSYAFVRNVSKEWQLAPYKSAERWANQLEEGSWTPEKISKTIKDGMRYKAINKTVLPNRPATRYQIGDDFVVVDDKTKEVIQVSRASKPGGFHPNIIE